MIAQQTPLREMLTNKMCACQASCINVSNTLCFDIKISNEIRIKNPIGFLLRILTGTVEN